MIEVHILVPVADNTGKLFEPSHDDVFETELLRLFGGYSGPSDPIAGGWAHGGVIYRDQNRTYTVALKSLTDGGLVREAVDFGKGHYGQLNLYIRYLGLSEIL